MGGHNEMRDWTIISEENIIWGNDVILYNLHVVVYVACLSCIVVSSGETKKLHELFYIRCINLVFESFKQQIS